MPTPPPIGPSELCTSQQPASLPNAPPLPDLFQNIPLPNMAPSALIPYLPQQQASSSSTSAPPYLGSYELVPLPSESYAQRLQQAANQHVLNAIREDMHRKHMQE